MCARLCRGPWSLQGRGLVIIGQMVKIYDIGHMFTGSFHLLTISECAALLIYHVSSWLKSTPAMPKQAKYSKPYELLSGTRVSERSS